MMANMNSFFFNQLTLLLLHISVHNLVVEQQVILVCIFSGEGLVTVLHVTRNVLSVLQLVVPEVGLTGEGLAALVAHVIHWTHDISVGHQVSLETVFIFTQDWAKLALLGILIPTPRFPFLYSNSDTFTVIFPHLRMNLLHMYPELAFEVATILALVPYLPILTGYLV